MNLIIETNELYLIRDLLVIAHSGHTHTHTHTHIAHIHTHIHTHLLVIAHSVLAAENPEP